MDYTPLLLIIALIVGIVLLIKPTKRSEGYYHALQSGITCNKCLKFCAQNPSSNGCNDCCPLCTKKYAACEACCDGDPSCTPYCPQK